MILYAKDFFVAWRYVPVLVIANVFNILSSFMGTVYTGAKKTKMLSISTMIGAGSNILLNFALIPLFGAMGAAMSTVVSYAIIQLIRIVHSRRILSFEVNHSRDIFMFLLLISQACLVLTDTYLGVLISTVFTIVIFIMSKSVLLDIINVLKSKLNFDVERG